MSSNDEVKRVQALANNPIHVHRSALEWAGRYLVIARDEMIERETEGIKEEDEDLFAAYQGLIEKIGDEVVRIGKELTQQSKSIRR